MPTYFCLKCLICGAPLEFLWGKGDEYVLRCTGEKGHQKRYPAWYMKRFVKIHASSSGGERKVPEICPSCGNPSKKKETEKGISITCSGCGDEFVYDDRREEWVSVHEGIEV